jgi:tripartite ATP-independent transporter DctM subunit
MPELPNARELWASFLDSVWALIFPVFLILGFRFGLFTATEAGVFLVFYALLIGLFVYREVTFGKLVEAFRSTMGDLGMVMLLIMMAAVLGYAMTIERAPQQITEFMTSLTQNRVGLLIIVCAILVVSGMFLEGAANILLITPIVLPVLTQAGWDPVHMGILIVSLINFGGLTPPVGVIMFTVCGILDVKTAAYARAALPFFVALLVFFIVVAALPALSTMLPNMLM